MAPGTLAIRARRRASLARSCAVLPPARGGRRPRAGLGPSGQRRCLPRRGCRLLALASPPALRFAGSLLHKGGERRARELRLGDEAARPALGDERAEVASVATRRQDNDRTAAAAERGGDLKPVQVREEDVEEDDVRREATRLEQGGAAVLGLTDDLVAVGLEQQAHAASKRRVVIDDQNRLLHRFIVPQTPRSGAGPGSPYPELATSRDWRCVSGVVLEQQR